LKGKILMNKKLLVLTTTLIFLAYVGEAYAEDITVTCDKPNGCIMTPSAGTALFNESEADNTNMLPGYTSQRTLELINDTDSVCNLVLGNVTNVILGENTSEMFPYQLWIAMVDSGGVFYGGLSGGQADATKSLGDLFSGGLLPITTILAGESKDIEWYVTFDPDAGNTYQDALTKFDFDMHFMCDEFMGLLGFTIEKFTDAWPTGQIPGAIVSYRIVIRVLDNSIDDVLVVDLSPEFFEYITNSWSIASNIKGNLANIGVTEPTYASPGEWDLGDREAGEVVTLTYDARILEGATDGIYPDLAFAYGNLGERTIWAEAADSGFEINGGVVDENFVGTQVKVDTVPSVEEKDVEVEVEEIEEEREVEGEVLGAADQRLPATGATTLLGLGSLITIIVSGGLLIILKIWEKSAKQKIPVLGILFSVIFMTISVNTVNAVTNNLVLRVSEPETPTNQAFNVDFVALVLETKKLPVKIICSLKKPGESAYTKISTETLINGGDSGLCKVTEALLTSKGTYYIEVKATTSSDSAEGNVSVYYDGDAPSTPKWIEKDKKSDCEYEIEFKTADDGQTSYVEVYRSDSKEFTVGPSSKIRTINIGPNEKYSFTHDLYGNDCGKSYYAVRAFDDAGNYSGIRVEEIEDIVIKEVIVSMGDEESGEEIMGAIFTEAGLTPESELAPEDEVVSEEEGEPSEEEVAASEEAEVLGAEDRGFPWFWLFLAGLIVGFVIARARKKDKNAYPLD